MYLLDTDHLSLIQRGTAAGRSILLRLTNENVPLATTIVTYEEQTRGWLDFISRAKTIEMQRGAYQFLSQHQLNYRTIDVIAFDDAAIAEYQNLRKTYPRLGKMDLKIAAIAISRSAKLLTRNQRDFGQITMLQSEDWTL
jgi:tRNA(fMet)-specific endonuclease VapC